MQVRVTVDGRSIEDLCFDWLKAETGDHDRAALIASNGYVESVLTLNPGLSALQAAHGDSLPIGTVIELPELPDETIVQTISLW